MTITGTNFTGTTQVYFGSVAATSFTVNSDTSITATAPAEAAGTVDVTVYNAGAFGHERGRQLHFQSVIHPETWTGLGTTNNWSDPANWSANVVPGPGTTVIFDGTSSKNAIVDPGFAGTVAAVQINSGYTGTVSLDEGLTVTGAFTSRPAPITPTARDDRDRAHDREWRHVPGLDEHADVDRRPDRLGGHVRGLDRHGHDGQRHAFVRDPERPFDGPHVAGGNFTYTGGTFNADLGTVTYTGTVVSPTVSVGTGSVRFYNFKDAMTGSYPAGMTITGTLTVTGTFTWKTGSGIIYGNIEAQGDVDDQNHGGTGNPYLTLDGTANQTIEDTSGGGGGFLRTLTINKPGGTVSLACNPLVFSNFTFTAGTVNTGTYSWLLGGQGPISAAPGCELGNIEIDGAKRDGEQHELAGGQCDVRGRRRQIDGTAGEPVGFGQLDQQRRRRLHGQRRHGGLRRRPAGCSS